MRPVCRLPGCWAHQNSSKNHCNQRQTGQMSWFAMLHFGIASATVMFCQCLVLFFSRLRLSHPQIALNRSKRMAAKCMSCFCCHKMAEKSHVYCNSNSNRMVKNVESMDGRPTIWTYSNQISRCSLCKSSRSHKASQRLGRRDEALTWRLEVHFFRLDLRPSGTPSICIYVYIYTHTYIHNTVYRFLFHSVSICD